MKDAIQEQLIAARRDLILDGATRVFASKGFHQATIKDIAREAGVADGTIYNYFANKVALLLGIFERMRASIQPEAEVLATADLDIRRFLEAYFRYPLLVFSHDNFALFRVILSEMMVNQELRDLYQHQILEPTLRGGEVILQQWAERQAIQPEHLHLTIRAISGMILGLMVERIMGDAVLQAEWETLPAYLATLFLDGIGVHQP